MKHLLYRPLAAGRGLLLAGVVVAGVMVAAQANPGGPGTVRDPMLPPAEARPAAVAAPSAPAAALAPARHLMVIDGRRYVMAGGRKRGVGDLLGEARIEGIEDNAVLVRHDGVLHRLPLHGEVRTRPAAESVAASIQPPARPAAAATALRRPPRPADAGSLSLARPERPIRPEVLSRAGDPP